MVLRPRGWCLMDDGFVVVGCVLGLSSGPKTPLSLLGWKLGLDSIFGLLLFFSYYLLFFLFSSQWL